LGEEAVTTYSLTFVEIGGTETASCACRDLDSACDKVLEFLEYGFELKSVEGQTPSYWCGGNPLQEVLRAVNYRIENPDWEEREEEFARKQRNEDRRDYYAGRM
jgi:hypothetical protein